MTSGTKKSSAEAFQIDTSSEIMASCEIKTSSEEIYSSSSTSAISKYRASHFVERAYFTSLTMVHL